MASTSVPPHIPDSSESEDAAVPVHLQITTFTHEGRFWDVYLEFVEDTGDPDSFRACLCFVPTDRAGHEEPRRTAVIIIEPTREKALRAARAFDRYHLAAMLRSVT